MLKFRPIVLIILDGWGLSPSWGGNALVMNNPKNMDSYWRNYPHLVLQALGAIPNEKVVGESRLGHMLIGTGRIVEPNLSRINKEINNRNFFSNQVLNGAIDWAKKNNSNLHLMGLLSNGGVHADIDHIFALLNLAKEKNFERVYLDIFTDGTDMPPTSALGLVNQIKQEMTRIGLGCISSISGRHWAMDRNNHWDRTAKAYQNMVEAKGEKFNSAEEAISENYRKGTNDEFINPALIKQKDGGYVTIKDNDAVIYFNFREDRARSLTRAFIEPNFKTLFWRPKKIKDLYFAGFVNYQNNLPIKVVFENQRYNNCLSEVLANYSIKQLKLAESEKEAHVTYFFNGGAEEPFANEDVKIIPSISVESYDESPEMSAKKLASNVLKAIESEKYDFITVNFANIDMIAHTGNIIAVGKAIDLIDKIVEKIVNTSLKHHGATIITADHGNAEQMIKVNEAMPDSEETKHTLNPVPFIYINPENKKNLIKSSVAPNYNSLSNIIQAKNTLADVAPTILEIMQIPKPQEMTGRSVLSILE